MIRQILLGSATAILVTGSASALTMNVTGDNRALYAEASAGGDFNSESGPAPASSTYDEQASASAQSIIFNLLNSGGSGGGAGGRNGAVANASAGQFSEIEALSISGNGYADASGNHGDFAATLSDADGAGGGGKLFFGEFEAESYSTLEVLFSIDEDAAFDLSGFLFAGNEVAVGNEGSDISNRASINLINSDTNESAYNAEISNDSLGLDEQGVIAAGNYRFTVSVEAAVNGRFENEFVSSISDIPTNKFGYVTSAGFKGVNLGLTAVDQPIPEPVTTTLAAMGLGALVLRTSRRRHH